MTGGLRRVRPYLVAVAALLLLVGILNLDAVRYQYSRHQVGPIEEIVRIDRYTGRTHVLKTFRDGYLWMPAERKR